MAAFTGTPVSTGIITAQAVSPKDGGVIGDRSIRFTPFYWLHTATEGSGTGEVNLCDLPPGKIRIWANKSKLVTTQFAAGADLHVGHRAYTDPEAGAVAEDDNAFADNLDVAAAALDQSLPLPAAGYKDVNSTGGVRIYALIDSGNIEATDVIRGGIAWQYL